MMKADKMLRWWNRSPRARRFLLYHFVLVSFLGAAVGLVIAMEDWREGLTLALASTSGVAVCATSIRELLVDDIRRLGRRLHRRHA